MKKRIKEKILNIPTTAQLEKQLHKEEYKSRYKKLLKNTIYTSIIVIAFSVLIFTFVFPILRVSGSSMNPTLVRGDIVLCIKKTRFESGDIIPFYYNNRILMKRVIATSSDWVNIEENGNVFVNGELLEELYIKEKSYGKSNIEFPYQVPEGSYFVLGDNRESSVDSRNSLIGTISEEEIIGKAIFRIWPIKRFGIMK